MLSTKSVAVEGFRLSPQQRRLWWMYQDGEVHACQILLRIGGALDARALAAALADVVERHEILHTCFYRMRGMKVPLQVVAEAAAPALAWQDLGGKTEEERRAEVECLLAADRRRPFSLEDGEPLRAALLRLSPAEHLLLLSLPPLCADARTLANLVRELVRYYAGQLADEAAPETMQYADFSEWQNDWLEGEESEEGKDFWLRRRPTGFWGAVLPGQGVAVPPQRLGCEVLPLAFDPALAQAAEELARRRQVPLRVLLLASWQVLLARLTARRDVAVATACDGRGYAELEAALGPFARALPVRCEIDGGDPFCAIMDRVAAALEEAEAWQEYFLPDEVLTDEIAGATPAFLPFAFELEERPAELQAAGVTFGIAAQFQLAEPFEVRLLCSRTGDCLAAELHYEPHLLGAGEAALMGERWLRLLAALLADPERGVGEHDVLAEAERRLLLDEWNRTAADFPRHLSVHELFETQAAARPEATALHFGAGAVTYGELDRRSDRLAAELRRLGVGPGIIVGLLGERSPATVAGLLAVLKTGAAYVALDPEYPAARLAYLLELTSPAVLLADRRLLDRLPPHSAAVCSLDAPPPAAADSDPSLGLAPDPAGLAYVVFTSGSSGRPKGVLVPHYGVVNYLTFLRAAYGLAESDVVLQIPDLSFDSSVRDLLGPLSSGGQVVLVDRALARDPEGLLRTARERGVTCLLSVVPTMLRALCAAAGGPQPRGAMRLVLASGEPLRGGDLDGVRQVFGASVRLVNQYGPTECTMTSSYHPVIGGGDAVLPIGNPIPNLRFYVLDPRLQPVPLGGTGELYIGGVGIAWGYLGAPHLTAERFLPDPLGAEPGGRLYRTGDLASYRPDGVLEFKGRFDQQIKLRGVRVEPEEVEAALAAHPAVEQAVVVAREDAARQPALAAYLVLDRHPGPALPEERRLMLPNQMTIAQLNRYETEFFYQQIFVDQVELRHGIALPDDAVIFDVGANVGLFSLFAHLVCRRPRVYAFEPIPEIFTALRTNAELYGLDVRLFNCGVSSREGEVEFAYYPHSACQSGYYPDTAQETRMLQAIIGKQQPGEGGRLGEAESRYLDELVAERMESRRVLCPLTTVSRVLRDEGLDRIDLLKIDVEKSELDVLEGVRDEDWQKIRQVVIEGHDLEGRLGRIVTLLESHGYELVIEKDDLLEDTCLFNIYAFRGGRGERPLRPRMARLPVASSELFSTEELRGFVRAYLPESMIPSTFVVLDALPLTANGKVDRRALPDPTPAGDGERRAHVAPRTPTEEILVGIWAQILGVEEVGVTDDFFELGGHSLLGTQVVMRAQQAFGVEIPLRSLFIHPTVAGLALTVEAARMAGGGLEMPPLLPVSRTGDLPLSFAQQRLWFLDRLQPGTAHYNLPGAFRLSGSLDVATLARALAEVRDRHEALRTTFPERQGQPVQVIGPPAPVPLPLLDLAGLPTGQREAEAGRLLITEAQRPFDLTGGPLLRFGLLRLAAEEHLVLFNLHHIVGDGWSMGVLIGEVAALYAAFVRHLPSPLPELPVQYADFAVWQRRWMTGDVLATELSYWRRQLDGLPAVLELPADRPRPAVPSQRGERRRFASSPDLAGALRALGRQESATLFMTLVSAFALLLYRWSGEERFGIGTPVAGRSHIESEGLIGFFNNTLVLRCDLAGGPTFRELLARMREISLAAYAHQELPFEKLVEELQPERSLSHSPLYQVSFVLQNQSSHGAKLAPPDLPGLALTPVEFERGTAKFDLILSAQELAGGIVWMLEYSTDLFEAATASSMERCLEVLLRGIAADPGRPVAELPLLSEADRRQLLCEVNATAEPSETGVVELFEAQAARTPAAVAVSGAGQTWTYAELDRRANQLAHRLRSFGVGPDVLVALFMERSPEMVVSVLGVLKAGGAYLPLDPGHPLERLATLLDDAQPPILLTQADLQDRLPAHWGFTLCLEPGCADLDGEPESRPAVETVPDNLAYVIYTSGSTGRPKGVMVPRVGLANYLRWCLRAYRPAAGASAPVHSSLAFDLTVTSLLPALLAGGSVRPLPESAGGEALAATLRGGEDISILKITPAHLDLLAHHLVDVPLAGKVQVLVVGGEALHAESLAVWREHAPATRIVNEYGPTETVVGSCVYEVGTETPTTGAVPIGRPITNTRVLVLDAAGQPVPPGVPGELLLGGAGVTRGYLNRADLTAERFVPDPFTETPGARLYRTGDRVRWRADLELEFLGRVDQQVKVRGFRIEPGEIEAVLVQHPQVREAVVTTLGDAESGRGRAGDRLLAAYVVPRQQGSEPGDLRAFCAARLPDYMVPAAFVLLPALPLTPNGKVDRRALPDPRASEDAAARGADVPRTQVEEILAGIWAEVLRRDSVGTGENFFDLGGHSLLATQVVSRLRDAVGAELTVARLFEAPTVRELAAAAEAALRSAAPRAEPPLVRAAKVGPSPLSFAQERLWFLDRLQPGSPVYNVAFAVRIAGPLDASMLRRVLAEIVRRHEVLRTRFELAGEWPVQVVASAAAPELPIADLGAAAAPEDEVRRVAEEEARAPFDLARGPLARFRLLRLGGEDHVLLATLHHIVTDGWSTRVLMRELAALYPAFAVGAPSPLPEPPVQYGDYARWQREWLQGEVLEQQLAYWRGRLADASALELPTDRPRPAVQTHNGASCSLTLSVDLARTLAGAGRHYNATSFMVLLAGFQALLQRYSGEQSVAVGTPVAGRTRVETEDLIGFFVNTLVLRSELPAGISFGELLEQARRTTLEAQSHQDLPFEMLVEALRPVRDISRTPLFQVMFLFEREVPEALEMPGLRLSALGIDGGSAKFDLTLTVVEREEGALTALRYNTDLFDGATARRMLEHLRAQLAGAVEEPSRALAEVPLLTAAERHQLLAVWSGAGEAAVPAEPVVATIESQVLRAPGSVAVSWGGEELTYRDLGYRAGRLARRLRGLGVGPDVVVGVCVERSPAMVVGILAVLKAGGAYLPLDPAYPRERLAYMLEDSGAPVLLAERALLAALPAAPLRTLEIDDDVAAAEDGGHAPACEASPDNLAYLIYTSGSTGLAKGVAVTRRTLASSTCARFAYYPDPVRVFLLMSSFAFDSSVAGIFWTLCAGGELLLPEPSPVVDVPRLAALLADRRVSHLACVPSLYSLLLEMAPAGYLSHLRTAIVAGEACPAALAVRHRGLLPEAELVNEYGPTEATVWSSAFRAGAPAPGRHLPIGRAVAGARIWVVDPAFALVPPGVTGELLVGGEGVARGYHGRPALTAESFIPDPWAESPGARLYRTGDLVRFRPDGNLEFLGRVDDQLKVRGFRVEPGEVEALLAALPEVAGAAVALRGGGTREPALVAYVELRPGAEVSLDALRGHLREHLPAPLLPARFMLLETLPRTATGKIDRRALPPPATEARAAGPLPATELERTVAEVWQELLGVEGIGVEDNFFDLGGHSLLLVRAQRRLLECLGREVPVVELFRWPTVGALARYLAGGEGETSLEPEIERASARRSAAQRRGERRRQAREAGAPAGGRD